MAQGQINKIVLIRVYVAYLSAEEYLQTRIANLGSEHGFEFRLLEFLELSGV